MITIINIFNHIKPYFNVILGILMFLLVLFTINLYNKNAELKSDNARIITNINSLNTKNSSLIMTYKELKDYIKRQNTRHKVEIDSILKVHKVKIKHLQRYQKIVVNVTDTDTIIVERYKPVLKNDSVYDIEFNNVRKCFKISGYLRTKDSTSTVHINKLECNNNIYITKVYKKTFWDYVFFRKGKLITTKTSDCGEVSGEEIDVDK
jgi:hypothetical protein